MVRKLKLETLARNLGRYSNTPLSQDRPQVIFVEGTLIPGSLQISVKRNSDRRIHEYYGCITDGENQFLDFKYLFYRDFNSQNSPTGDECRFLNERHLRMSEGRKIGLIGRLYYFPDKITCPGYIRVRPDETCPEDRVILPWKNILE